MIYDFDGKKPDTEKAAYIAESADIIGDVTLAKNSSVWFGAALRGDEVKIEIGECSNVQDNATIHNGAKIGRNVTIGHNAIVHGCEIGDNALIGMGAVVLDGAKIGEGSIVGAAALVTGGKVFPPKSLILGAPAKVVRELTDEDIAGNIKNAEEYVKLSAKYKG